MATINQVTLTISGNTGSIEFHTRQDGGIWATFDVAQTSRTQNPQTGQWEDGATTWIRCTASGYLAEHLQHSMLPTGPDGKQKGVPVIVTGSYVQREYTNQQGAKRSILELRATDLAVSLRAGTVAYNKAPRDNGFAGRTPQPSQPMAQPQPQQPTTPASDPWNATGAQTRQPAFTNGYAPAAPQPPAICRRPPTTQAGPPNRRAAPHPEKRQTSGDMPWTNGSTPATRKERRRRSMRWTSGSARPSARSRARSSPAGRPWTHASGPAAPSRPAPSTPGCAHGASAASTAP